MSLVSSTGSPASFGTLCPTGTSDISESDGYFVEELNGEGLEEQPRISLAVSSLLHSTHFDLSLEQRRKLLKVHLNQPFFQAMLGVTIMFPIGLASQPND